MAIKRGKNKDDRPDFDDIIDDVEQEVKAIQTEQEITDRIPELRQLSEEIEKATLALVNADSCLKYAIEQYQKASKALDDAVAEIGGKVDSINYHIDNVVTEAPQKIRVNFCVDTKDMKKFDDIYANHLQQLTVQMNSHIHEVYSMLAEERKSVQQRYKEYDGCYLGHYIQWFFWFFFTLGFIMFFTIIITFVGNHYGWFK